MIKDIRLSWIYNSSKERTVKIFIKTDKGLFLSSSPSGKSTGKHEAKTKEINTIFKEFPEIKKKFIGKKVKDVDKIIEKIGIEEMGANLSIALSMASLKAVSKNQVYKFLNPIANGIPYPLGNVAGEWKEGSIQEFLVAPLKAETIEDAINTNEKIWRGVGEKLKATKKNREGGWLSKHNEMKKIDIITKVAEEYQASVGIDVAASNLYKDEKYHYNKLKKSINRKDQIDFILDLIKTYNLFYVEDPFHEEDFRAFGELTKKAKCLIVGDDLYTTNEMRIELGAEYGAGNGIIIKPNQAGTVTRALKTVSEARKAEFTTIVSHRSGDTLDTFIADLAVGLESPLIKCGIYGKERKSKLKRLVEIWKEIENPVMTQPIKF